MHFVSSGQLVSIVFLTELQAILNVLI